MPLNSNGKIDRKKLPLPSVNDEDLIPGQYIAPQSELQNKVVELWKSILHIERISISDDVFELGANSLSVGAFVNRIHKETNLHLNIRDVFVNSTVQSIAAVLENSKAKIFEAIVPAKSQPSYPLSSAQRQLWVLNQLEEVSMAYHIPGVYVFEGDLDFSALQYAFDTLIERHESLRTIFKENELGETRQFILSSDNISFSIDYLDFREEAGQYEQVREAVREGLIQAFDLANGPMLRAALFQVEDKKWIFSYVVHHIISDGWSMLVFIKELLSLYNAWINRVANPLAPLSIQYKDYAVWQQEQLVKETYQQHKAHWLKQFEGDLPFLELPGDRPRPAIKTYNGRSIETRLSNELVQQIKTICQAQGGTLFMGLLAAVNTVLYRYSGQEDIIIGSPIAGREHADLEDQIGFYVNTLALRTKFRGQESFKKLLDNVRQVTLKAYEHQAYPFEELVYDINPKHDISRGTLFDVMVVLQNTGTVSGANRTDPKGLKVSAYPEEENLSSKFDLTFDFIEINDEIHLRIEYNTDIYNHQTISGLASHFENLLASAVKQPDLPLNKLEILSAAEKNELLLAFNQTNVEYPSEKTVMKLFEEQVEKTPYNRALVFEDISFTYGELNEEVNKLAYYIRKTFNTTAGDLVGIKLERNEWLVITMLAVLKAGGACMVLDIEYPRERIDFMMMNSGSSILIDSEAIGKFKAVSGTFTSANLSLISKPDDLIFVIYTSGSTGNPKGCMLSHKGVMNHLFSKINTLKLKDGEAFCHNSELHFVGGIWQLLAPLITGGSLVLCNKEEMKNINKLLHKVDSAGARILEVIPSQLNEHLANEQGIAMPTVKTLILTGEKLNAHFVNKCFAGNPQLEIINTYGQTEFSDVTSSYYIPRHLHGDFLPVGSPIQNTRIYILSPDELLCPVGVIGEICTSGDGITKGYINDAVLTDAKFVNNPYEPGRKMFKTGDLARWKPDGTIEVFGRKDDQVKIRGHRIETGEVESALLKYGEIEEAVLLFKERADSEKFLVAYLVASGSPNAAQLKAYLSTKIPDYMRPSQYIQIEKMPLLPNGKIDKKALAVTAGVSLNMDIEYVAPGNDIEHKLVNIWKEILQQNGIGILDNFFDLGGHSLKATTMVNKIRHAYNVNLTLKDIFQSPNLSKLAEEIERKIWLKDSQCMNTEVDDSRELVRI